MGTAKAAPIFCTHWLSLNRVQNGITLGLYRDGAAVLDKTIKAIVL
jgi:hypothetical protein